MPIERFKDAYENWRYNPFTDADLAVDKTEDGLYIPSSSPFIIQLLEVPRKNEPSTVAVRAYGVKTDVDQDSSSGQKVLYVASTTGFSASDKIIIDRGGDKEEEGVIDTIQAGVSLTLVDNLAYTHTAADADDVEKYTEYTEVVTAPTQGQFRVDYPPADGEGTGLIEFNQNDANKEVQVDYKATGSPIVSEYLDTKVSYPAGSPANHQIIGFMSGAPEWRYNPIRYFHEGPVIYHSTSEDYSSLLFRFKKTDKEATALLELKGALLFQGFYTEYLAHTHGPGTYVIGSGGAHNHSAGTLAGSQPTHVHGIGTLAISTAADHSHAKGTLAGTQPTHSHSISGSTGNQDASHTHPITAAGIQHKHQFAADYFDPQGLETGPVYNYTGTGTGNQSVSHKHTVGTLAIGSGGDEAVTIAGSTANAGSHNHSLSGSMAAAGDDAVSISGNVASGGNHAHNITGSSGSAGVSPKTYPNQLKIYINGTDKTTDILALTSLTQFGDGTGSHAFVTTGSGEMDISSLVSANQIHELKITEPISGSGGRCLIHLELY